jgi:hypothetical protein
MAQTTRGEADAQATHDAARDHRNDLEQAQTEIRHLREQLIRAESEAARVPELEAQAAHAASAQRVLAQMKASPSWRLTKPLRTAKRLLRR